MKKAKKVVALALCAVMLVVGSVAGTMAFLYDKDTVTNTFTVGQVAIELDETDVDVNGVKDGNTRVKDNDYKLMPGHTYTKDPMVTVNAGSEESYVRMLVKFNYSSQLDQIFPNADLTKILLGYNRANWAYVGNVEDTTANTRTYEFRYVGEQYKGTKPGTVQATTEDIELDALFDQIKMPGTVTNEQLAQLVTKDAAGKIVDQFKIEVVAHAIQADGFASAEAAWSDTTTNWNANM